MALASNLARAEMAVAYVDSAMRWPTSNRLDDVEHRDLFGLQRADLILEDMRAEFAEVVSSRRLLQGRGSNVRNYVDFYLAKADVAIEKGVGLCDEMASVAFKWLVEIRQVPCNVSLYKMYKGGRVFHSFLILGEKRPPRHRHSMSENHPPATWPLDAVWCDPWRRDWFEIKDDWRRRVRMIPNDCDVEPNSPLHQFKLKCLAFAPAADRLAWRHF